MKTWLTTVLACTSLALILGCNNSSADPADATSLQGTSWKLAAWSASSLDPAHFTITAAFADGQISGRSAVNSYGGPYSANAAGAFATGPLAMTEMAGEPAAMRAESLYHSLLAQANRWRRDGSQLVLSAGAQDLLIFNPR
jgi:heat shock protein HslJ